MQRISINVSGIRRFCVASLSSSSASNLTDHRILKQVLESCKAPSNSKCVLQAHAHIFKLGYGTYPSLLVSTVAAYRRCNRSYLARRLLLWFLSLSPGVCNTNVIIESLMKIGESGLAKKVLRNASDQNVITWNLMIGGYVRNVQYEEALKTLKNMLSFSDIKPNKFSFASSLAACARLGDLHHAKWVHSLMIDAGIELNAILSSALVDVYAKCGDIETSREVFYSVKRNDVSIWNAMITGFATHGLATEAIRVFSEMEAEHVSPDSITFLGILTACSHCGFLEEGKEYFGLMSRRFSIQPKLEHYGAMVDLLGRAGRVKEAYELIESMQIEPDVVIWRSLLSSSRTYKNPELGEIAIQNLSKAKSGDYVLLSNIYSSTKKWESAQKVRELMTKEGIRKAKGKSWVEFGGVIHRFKAGDTSHIETKAIYKVLEGLIQKTKSEGFVSDTDLVLMDVSEEEKVENLNYHSEKLALAYVILKSSPGTEIRIQKNIRMCSDCHNWIKSVSKMLNRVIIMRDRIRFHRFEDGLCSCKDYW
ncbi:Pentatricopeptide repeat [Arabidopsis thaliana x Arabidopsis arenosa]|uniref:Pentatricopeptide repeat n=1 Tax=Arabidopsis thaliana x Arabidopsis arenosa TaxID=1240361 RepID=A0A8T1XIX5_9BRAS|nr:Pentatricopeptide repeat [Arabidopsis thaliana x Arabidopsis arenosa]